ncbi:MAG TPA: hypothetical protein VG847_11600 [Chitinophagaceae bacterium]|nr:hypothetical protein [Chitinophagaceae bacterium]
MKQGIYLAVFLAGALALPGFKKGGHYWITEKHDGYTLIFTPADSNNRYEYNLLIEKGILSVKKFFSDSFKKEFNVVIHPDRHSIDSTWQRDWNMPGFHSECWMVASGIASKLDMISPRMWSTESCEHNASDTLQTQRLITHELVHVFHGQINASPDFSNTENIDWFVEGLAAYASGQMDAARLTEVKKAIADNNVPATLDDFWKGKLKYGLSGSVVLFIDKKYGRQKLQQLLPFTKKNEILSALRVSETGLLNEWKEYMQRW